MSADERLAGWTPERLIQFIAIKAEKFAQMTGTGGMEAAGGLISYLASHSDDIEPFLNGGIPELPEDWYLRGCLTWHAQNGKVVHPDYARRARTIKRLERGEQP